MLTNRKRLNDIWFRYRLYQPMESALAECGLRACLASSGFACHRLPSGFACLSFIMTLQNIHTSFGKDELIHSVSPRTCIERVESVQTKLCTLASKRDTTHVEDRQELGSMIFQIDTAAGQQFDTF